MTISTSSTQATTTYTPPAELLEAAETALQAATPEELALAEALYITYGSVTGQRSAVTGAPLPTFDACKPLVRSGWLAVAQARVPTLTTTPLHHEVDEHLKLTAVTVLVDPEQMDAADPLLDRLFCAPWVSHLRKLAAADVVGWRVMLREAFEMRQRDMKREPADRAGKLKVGAFAITLDTSEAEAAMARLESRANGFVDALEKAGTLVEKLKPAQVVADDTALIDPFLMGLQEISSATRDLAEAMRTVGGDSSPVVDLIGEVTKALHTRVNALASPAADW